MEKKKRFEEAKRFINPKVPRRPKTLSLHELARRTASIRQNNVAMHKAHADRLALAEGINRATLHQNMRIERDVLLWASLQGALRAESHNRLQALNELLKGQ